MARAPQAKYAEDSNKVIQALRGINPKHEIRSSKQSQMTEFQMFKHNGRSLENLNRKVEFVSNWSKTDASTDIRISNFLKLKMGLR